jgi:TRAP-type C4-dicarboxylate transport system permease small subunit
LAGYALADIEDESYEPGRVAVLAILAIASAAVALASLPAAVAVGLQPAPLVGLAVGLVSLAAVIGGVLGAVRLGAVAWLAGRRLLSRRPARLDVTSAD